MKNIAKHSPTPWVFNNIAGIYNANGFRIADTWNRDWIDKGISDSELEANALHIVKCVNCYDELVEACKEAKKGLSILQDCMKRIGVDGLWNIKCLAMLTQALAKAQEEV